MPLYTSDHYCTSCQGVEPGYTIPGRHACRCEMIWKMRNALNHIVREAERAKKPNWTNRADTIDDVMRLDRYAEEAI